MYIFKFNQIFLLKKAQIWGNIISSSILEAGNLKSANETDTMVFCGAFDCPGTNKTAKISKPLETTVYTLCGIYVGFTIIGILLIAIFLNSYSRSYNNQQKQQQQNQQHDSNSETSSNNEEFEKKSKKSQFHLVINTVKHLRNKKQILIIPLNLWLGFSQAYMGADYARSFVNCLRGIKFVGYTFICYGAADVIGSYFFGHFSKYIGRIPCFLVPGLLNYSMIFLMLFWVPRNDQIYVLFIIPGLVLVFFIKVENRIYK